MTATSLATFHCFCGEAFPARVWHCPACAHHWPFDRTECWNCNNSKYENARVQEHAGRSETINNKDKPVSSTQTRTKEAFPSLSLPVPTNAKSGLLEEGRFLVTPSIASQILQRFNYQHQRRVGRQHVAKLAVEMTNGVWTPGSQIAFGVMPDQIIHLVNGQHRLHAVIEAGMTIEFQVLLVPVKDTAALHELYYRFDTVQRQRSDTMIMRSTGLVESLGLSKEMASRAFTAGVIIANGLKIVHSSHMNPAFGTPDGKLAAIEKWWPQVQQYDKLIGPAVGSIKRRMMNISVMSVALVTLRHQPARAADFWGGIARDDGLTKGDARKAMLRVLTEYDFKDSTDNALIYTSHCWDAWFAGRSITYPKNMAGSLCQPLGTPFAPTKSGRS